MGNEQKLNEVNELNKLKQSIADFTNWIDGAKIFGLDINYKSPLSYSPQILLAEIFEDLFEDLFKSKSAKSLFSETETWYKNVIKELKKIDASNGQGIAQMIKNDMMESLKDVTERQKQKFLKIFKNGNKIKLPITATLKSSIKQCENEMKELIDKISNIDQNDPGIKAILERHNRPWDK